MRKRQHPCDPGGRKFELQVLEVLQRQLRLGRLGLIEKSCRLLHHKAYYSADRQASIITDIAIEIYVDGDGAMPSIMWIWECKDYKHSVPVDDIEEFHSKLQQIGSDKTKGTVIASGSFQRSALRYARSHGIGVARLLPDDRVSYFVRSEGGTHVSTAADRRQMVDILSNATYRSHNRAFFGITTDGRIERAGSIGGYLMLEFNGKPAAAIKRQE